MAESRKRVVLDINVLVSAIIFGGPPREILTLVIAKEILAITSPMLLAELMDVLNKKFAFSNENIQLIEKQIKRHFILVHPKDIVTVLKDNPDNRVLEAAQEGKCEFIVTGDKELLELKSWGNIKINKTTEFLNLPHRFVGSGKLKSSWAGIDVIKWQRKIRKSRR